MSLHESRRLARPSPERNTLTRPVQAFEISHYGLTHCCGHFRECQGILRDAGGEFPPSRSQESVDHLSVASMADFLDAPTAPFQHSREARRCEVGIVLIVEILGSPGLQRPVDAWRLGVDKRLNPGE